MRGLGLPMLDFYRGLLTMGFLVAGLFFLRFWRETRDRLFLMFAASMWLMALNRFVLVLLDLQQETRTLVYLVRLFAFVLIIAAVVDKNRRG